MPNNSSFNMASGSHGGIASLGNRNAEERETQLNLVEVQTFITARLALKALRSQCVSSCLLLSISAFLLLGSVPIFALDSTETLPAGINSPALRMGQVRGIEANFGSSGSLTTLHDSLSIEVDSRSMVQANPDAYRLVSVLNSFGNGRYGDQLSLGVLHIDSRPQINYTALVHAWGLSDRWTLGMGLPALRYQNQISLSESGSNVALFQQAFGGLNSDIDQGLAQVAGVSLASRFQTELSSKGYKPLESKSQSLWGDLQIVSLFRLAKTKLAGVTHKLTLTLPTGKKEDPSDLADLDLFGRAGIENQILGSFEVVPRVSLNARAGVMAHLPDQVQKRVPLNADDQLPDQAGLETVQRLLTLGNSAAASINLSATDYLSFGAGYEFRSKGKQRYTGVSSRFYEGLSRNSDAEAHTGRLEVGLSTVKAYQKKRFALPFQMSLELSDIFAGKNTPRETRTELALTLFY